MLHEFPPGATIVQRLGRATGATVRVAAGAIKEVLACGAQELAWAYDQAKYSTASTMPIRMPRCRSVAMIIRKDAHSRINSIRVTCTVSNR